MRDERHVDLIKVDVPYASEVVRATTVPAPLYALPFQLQAAGTRHVLLVSKSKAPLTAKLVVSGGDPGSPLAQVLEGVGAEPGFGPPVARPLRADGSLELGPFAVAIVDL